MLQDLALSKWAEIDRRSSILRRELKRISLQRSEYQQAAGQIVAGFGYSRPERWFATPIDKELRKSIVERDEASCRWCGEEAARMEVHHLIPGAWGGPAEPWNLVLLCWLCHRSETPFSADSAREIIRLAREGMIPVRRASCRA